MKWNEMFFVCFNNDIGLSGEKITQITVQVGQNLVYAPSVVLPNTGEKNSDCATSAMEVF